MKFAAAILIMLLSQVVFSQESIVPDNSELQEMRNLDQSSRRVDKINWSKLSQEDEDRRIRVQEMLDSNLIHTATDYRNAALIFHHGNDTTTSTMAIKMMEKSLEIDPKGDRWLLAAAIDRDKMYRGEPQIYGTQSKTNALGKNVQYEVDEKAITDADRKRMGVPSLKEQRIMLEASNKKSLIDAYNTRDSIDEMVKLIKKEYKKGFLKSKIDVSESGVNSFGYSLIKEHPEDALKIFKLNTELRPFASNPWDSYGECLLKLGQREKALAAYAKSLEIDPSNDNARRVIEEVQKEESE